MKFKEMKFLIKDAEQSEKIQKALFELGFSWYDGNQVYRGSVEVLYTEADGTLTLSNLAYANSEHCRDIPWYELKENQLTPSVNKEEEVLEIGGKLYKKADLEEALSKIKPIN